MMRSNFLTFICCLIACSGPICCISEEFMVNETLYAQWTQNHSLHLAKYGGDWLQVFPDLCQKLPVCVTDGNFGNITWKPAQSFNFYTKESACDLIARVHYKRIFFVGDSYIRHLYQAFLLVLSGDYEYGSLNSPTEACKGNLQFAEKRCSGINKFSKIYRSACNNSIRLQYYDTFHAKYTPDNVPFEDPETFLLWSEGSHPAFFNYSVGDFNDPIAYQDKFMNRYKVCRNRQLSNRPLPHNVMWVSTHVRPFKGHNEKEKIDDIVAYNDAMKDFFASKQCGHVQYCDVTNMTNMLQLAPLRRNLKKGKNGPLTYDGMHFSRTINVLKAQIVMNDLSNAIKLSRA